MKRKIKLGLTLGALSLLVTPLAIATSCGTSSSDNPGPGPIPSDWKPGEGTLFAPYLDPTQPTANIKEAEKATNNRLHSVTLAFLNRDRGTKNYTFAGKSISEVKNLYSGIKNFSPILAVGGVAAGDPGGDVLLPTLSAPSDGIIQSNDEIAAQLWSDIKEIGAHEFDWDIEAYALSNDTAGVKKAADVARIIQEQAKAAKYGLVQMLTMPTMGCNSQETDANKITQKDIDAVTITEGFSHQGQEALKAFYNKGVHVVANGMTMEYVWRTNYDVQTLLEIGGMYKAVEAAEKERNLNWTPTEIYNHLGVTPMIGHQAQAPGTYTFYGGVTNTAKWAKELDLGYIGFWSLTRDHPLRDGEKWQNNPTSYGTKDGTDFIYTKNFLKELGY